MTTRSKQAMPGCPSVISVCRCYRGTRAEIFRSRFCRRRASVISDRPGPLHQGGVVEPLKAMTRPAALQKEISVMQSMPMADVGGNPSMPNWAAIRCPHD